jgi:hypothetical protein
MWLCIMIILLYLNRPRGAEDTPIGIFISQKDAIAYWAVIAVDGFSSILAFSIANAYPSHVPS